jgi:hypothetical protein
VASEGTFVLADIGGLNEYCETGKAAARETAK